MTKIDIKNNSAEKAIKITTALTLIVAGYELIRAFLNYKEGMNILDLASYANADVNSYCLVLILANLILLPQALLLYRQNGISLKKEIFSKDTLGKDILFGIILAIISAAVSVLWLLVIQVRTDLAFGGWEKLRVSEIILMTISLGFVSGVCKEIYFRGIAARFCSEEFGEIHALLLFNVLFGLLDWFNMGFSFLEGLIWIFGYRKSKHLIVPMIAYGGVNLISIAYYIIMAR